jgi:nitrogen regulatory protein PII
MPDNSLTASKQYKLIITIVKKGMGSKVVAETKKVGAEGGTVIFGNGTAKKSVYLDLLGINFDPEKEIILTIACESVVDNIIKTVQGMLKLDKPGNGISFVLNVKGLTGIMHLLNQ